MSIISTGTGSTTLPVGNTAQRPSAGAGAFRYNSDYNIVEYYNGSRWVTGLGGSPETAASNGKDIYNAYNSSPSGVYWLKTPGGTTYQAYIKMDQGGGWVNLNTTLGPYTALTAGYGSGGSNLLSGGYSGTFGAFSPINASSGYQNQGGVYACNGLNGISYVNMDSTLKSDLGATQVRYKFYVSSMSNVTCGYICNSLSMVSIISGTGNYWGVCNNPPNQYSQVNPSSFTGEAIMSMSNGTRVFDTYTACTGSMYVAIVELYVR